MLSFQSSVIHRISDSEGEYRGYYRFLENDKVTEEKLDYQLQLQCKSNLHTDKIVIIGDTTTINLESFFGRISDGGKLYNIAQNSHNTFNWGFRMHPLLVIDRNGGIPRGIASSNIIDRPQHENKRSKEWDRKKHPIEVKESFRWVKACLEVRDTVLAKPKHKLFVMDREADIIEVLDRVPNETSDVLIRSEYDRRVKDKHGQLSKISKVLEEEEVKGGITLKIKTKKRKPRKAKLQVKFIQVEVQWPSGRKVNKKINPDGIKVSLIEVKEIKHEGNKNEPPLEWRLLTTESIEDLDQAVEMIGCYEMRWKIEEFFKILKSDGLNIESTELTKGKCIRKLTIISMKISLKIMQLKACRNGEDKLKIEEVFSKEEVECLRQINKEVEGTTKLQQNPYNENTMPWASWIIARLGGWKQFYNKHRPPGNKTFAWGLEKFEAIMIGYYISKKLDVS